MKQTHFFLIMAILVLSAAGNIQARPKRVGQIPNGGVNACANCHVNSGGGGERNAFGKMVETHFLTAAGSAGDVKWGPALASMDADGDGISNGMELQDAFGSWSVGQPDPGNAARVTKPYDKTSSPAGPITIQLTGMAPHVGQKLSVRVVDRSNMMESGRSVVASVTQADFSLPVDGVIAGNSYNIDIFADLNNNGKYDAPPADHAWRLYLNNAAGNEVINFAHNTNFTDIHWMPLVTIQFTGMTPHVGQLMGFRADDESDSSELGRKMLGAVPQADFSVEIPVKMSMNEVKVEFFADLNQNGIYDAPPADHAWQLKFNSSGSDTILNFTHNTDFTDIKWKYQYTLNLLGMTPHLGQMMELRVVDPGNNNEIGRIKLDSVAMSDFSVLIPGIESGHSYNADFYVDFNKNGSYDAPPTDHAWRITFNSGIMGDFTDNFTHNTNFTDIQWPVATGVEQSSNTRVSEYKLMQNYPNPFNPATSISFELKEAAFTSLKVYDMLGREVAVLVNNQLPAGTFRYNFNASGFQSGVYFYKIEAGNFTATRKMLLLK